MKIIEYEDMYANNVKNLLEELQEYIVAIDPYHFNILKDDYKDKIYTKDMEEVIELIVNKILGKIFILKMDIIRE